MRALPEWRDPELCTYGRAALAWTVLLMYLGRLGARRQIRFQLDTPAGRERLSALGGEPLDEVPHGDTVADYLAGVDPPAVQGLSQQMVRALLEARRLEEFRLLGKYYLVAVDLSGVLYLGDRASDFTVGCLTQTAADGRTLYYRPVCEAKLLTRTGLALSLGSEFLENPPHGPAPGVPQDSELPAAGRLFPAVKAAFGGFAFCALLDARHANETSMGYCEANKWRFIITLKEGALPEVWQEFAALLPLCPENRCTAVAEDGTRYEYAWVNDIPYRKRRLQVFQCAWTGREGKAHRFVWITDLPVNAATVEPLVQEGGRIRWKIENEGFRAQKHAGFAMEHAYAKDPTTAKNFYLLLQAAHILSQMLECLAQGKKAVKRAYGSLRNLAVAFLEAFRRDPLPAGELLREFLARPTQVRLDTS